MGVFDPDIRINKSSFEIGSELELRARRHAKTTRDLELFARKVHRYWKRIAPVGDPSGARYVANFGGPLPKHWNQTDSDAGSYKAGIVMRRKREAGWPVRIIAATDYKSHWIEYGTGGATPTPEFACRQRTATRFGAMGGVKVNKELVDKKRRYGVRSLRLTSTPSGKPRRRGLGYEKPDAA